MKTAGHQDEETSSRGCAAGRRRAGPRRRAASAAGSRPAAAATRSICLRAALAVLRTSCHAVSPWRYRVCPSTTVSITLAGELPKTAADDGSSTGSYGLPATETTVRSARLPGVRLPRSRSSPSASRRIQRSEAQGIRGAGARPVAARGPVRRQARLAARPRGRARASRRASRCRGRRARPAARSATSGAIPQPSSAFERGQWATGTSAAARRPISSSSTRDAVGAEELRAEQLRERRDRRACRSAATSTSAAAASGPEPCSGATRSHRRSRRGACRPGSRARGRSGRPRASRCTARGARSRSGRARSPRPASGAPSNRRSAAAGSAPKTSR